MEFVDKLLQCSDCGATFTFSAGEQEFFALKGFTNEPKRCPSCRQAKRMHRRENGGYGYQPRQMFSAICSECGKECEVPFEPHGDRPVYCSECYSRIKSGR